MPRSVSANQSSGSRVNSNDSPLTWCGDTVAGEVFTPALNHKELPMYVLWYVFPGGDWKEMGQTRDHEEAEAWAIHPRCEFTGW